NPPAHSVPTRRPSDRDEHSGTVPTETRDPRHVVSEAAAELHQRALASDGATAADRDRRAERLPSRAAQRELRAPEHHGLHDLAQDRKSTRLNSSLVKT